MRTEINIFRNSRIIVKIDKNENGNKFKAFINLLINNNCNLKIVFISG